MTKKKSKKTNLESQLNKENSGSQKTVEKKSNVIFENCTFDMHNGMSGIVFETTQELDIKVEGTEFNISNGGNGIKYIKLSNNQSEDDSISPN